MKFLKLFLLLAVIPFFTACDEDDDVNVTPQQSIVDIATSDAQFSTLVAALEKAELVTTLQGNGPFTVFAPTNAAFDQLLSDLGVSSLDDLSKEALTPILLYHVLGVEAKSTDLSAGYVSTLSPGPGKIGVSVKVDLSNGVSLNNDTKVTTADVDASNGVVHIIDKVLLPPNIVEIALGNENFSILVQALTRADLTTDFVSLLSSNGEFTVFAPTNDAFVALLDSNPDWNTLDDIDVATLEAVLKYHVVSGSNIESGDITDGAELTTVQGGKVTAVLDGEGVSLKDGQGATSRVIIADVQGSNGIIHAIDQVILP